MNVRASEITRVDLSQDQTIASGETITVFGIVCANSTDQVAEIDIQDGNSTKELTITVPPKNSQICEIEWIASNGIIICGLASTEVFVTVFHSAGGS
jgi:hypothetical protein